MSKNKPVTIWSKYGTFDPSKPATVWKKVGSLEPAKPASVWRETGGNFEFYNTGVFNIADPLGNKLVDMLGNYVVDTGIDMRITPLTTWREDDSI